MPAMDMLQKAFAELAANLIIEVIRYIGIAGGVFLLIWVIFRKRFLHRLIQEKFPPNSRLKKEFLYSLSSMLIFSLIGVAIHFAGGTRLYFNVNERGWPYFFL